MTSRNGGIMLILSSPSGAGKTTLTKKIQQKYQNYINENKDYIETKGYDLTSNKLTTGRIEIARLETQMTEKQVLTKLKHFDKIQSLILL